MVRGNLLTHDDDLVPLGTGSASQHRAQTVRGIDERIPVTPDKVNLAKLAEEILAIGLESERTVDQIGGLVVQAVRHVEIGFGHRIGLIQVYRGLATEGVIKRNSFNRGLQRFRRGGHLERVRLCGGLKRFRRGGSLQRFRRCGRLLWW